MLTYEESKTVLALYSVTSSPLILSNDLREGFIQPRLLSLFTNKLMIKINQQYTGFAGDRIWSGAVGKEIWAKPLVGNAVAVVLFNRNGTTTHCNAARAIDAPCDDKSTEGTQVVGLDFMLISRWLSKRPLGHRPLECVVTDVWTNQAIRVSANGKGASTYSRELPPHGAGFIIVGNCTS